jgi:hypothetical protein
MPDKKANRYKKDSGFFLTSGKPSLFVVADPVFI